MRNIDKDFNIVIVGYGGQGIISLANIISALALEKGFKVLQSEIHGLAQRSGSVEVFVRFNKNIFSPKVKEGGADLVIALDYLEALRTLKWADSKKTILLAESSTFWPLKSIRIPKVKISEFFKETYIKSFKEIIRKANLPEQVLNIFILGEATKNRFLPFSKNEVKKAIFGTFDKFLELNEKAFELAFK